VHTDSITPLQQLKQLDDFHEILFENDATGGHPSILRSEFHTDRNKNTENARIYKADSYKVLK
jgi:hypothetical protein